MRKTLTMLLAVVALLAACATPTSQEREAVRIEGAPGKAVIYIVRTNPDLSYLPATITVDGAMIGTTHAGTYARVEVAPGRHRIAGYAGDSGSLTLDVQADRIYFIQHTVGGNWRVNTPDSSFHVIDEARARAAMVGASPLS